MQNQSFFSNVCDSQIDYFVMALDKPETLFRFEYCLLGDGYLLGREKKIWTMLDSKVFLVRSQALPAKTTKSREEILLGLDFPRKIRVNSAGQFFDGWLIAIDREWICLEIAAGRLWLNLQGLREISLGVVDN